MPIYQASLSALPSVRQLRAFAAVCQLGGASAAADRLGITQPAVTMLLRQLEDRFSVKLFDRTGRQLRMTEAAHEALAYAERVLADLERMAGTMSEISQATRGTVSVAATATVAQSILPRAMRQLRSTHADIRVRLCEVAPEAFVDTLLAGRADLGVGILEAPVPGLVAEVVGRDPLVAVALQGTGLQSHGRMPWADLADQSVITIKPGYGVRRQIDSAAMQAGVILQIVQEVSLLSTALALAASGLGVALVPASLAAHVADASLVVRPLIDPVVERSISVVIPRTKTTSPAAQAFCAAVRKACLSLASEGHARIG